MKNVVGRKKQPAIAPVLTLPISNAAFAYHARFAVVVNPNLPAGCRIEGDDVVIFPDDIHHLVYDDGVTLKTMSADGRVEPDLLQLAYVGFIDLLQCRVLIRVHPIFIGAPRGVCLSFRGTHRTLADISHAHDSQPET